ncbi:DUF4258 domain-containing protein [Acidithiobacillus ferrooxidans]|uniref:DUF4258 domain-containing protein n=1 Tax=Acidithiobacillus ferrooxidans TaxID=920 RepID=UPI000B0740C8|nr:DUF4258 domain-containing protein [Acidithiobacillus ferrooxidans]MCR2830917.1 DUF4258 domain-containing protein [Acidithiobacillus ferrooxidans]
MLCDDVCFSRHALQRMFQRAITQEAVLHTLGNGQVVEEYLDDRPYPSRLLLGNQGGCPLHVVVAYDPANRQCIVITAYIPGPDQWDDTFSRRTSCNV